MKSQRLIAIAVVLLGLSAPILKITVVPAWTIKVVDESGTRQSEVEVRQIWKHYSFGGGLPGNYEGEEVQTSDLNGEIAFPERSFRVGLASWAIATVGTPLRWINVHASTGPHSYFICVKASCSSPQWYHGNRDNLENNVITIESDETIRKRLDEIKQRTVEKPFTLSKGDSDEPPVPPLPQKSATP